MAIIDSGKKTYSYLSRYAELNTYYNSIDKKRYYETSKRLSKDISSYNLYTVKQGDSLDSIALKYYNNPLYWWIIADINNIVDSLTLIKGKHLIIPDLNQISFE